MRGHIKLKIIKEKNCYSLFCWKESRPTNYLVIPCNIGGKNKASTHVFLEVRNDLVGYVKRIRQVLFGRSINCLVSWHCMECQE